MNVLLQGFYYSKSFVTKTKATQGKSFDEGFIDASKVAKGLDREPVIQDSE